MRYGIIQAGTLSKFRAMVQEHLDKGWSLEGGVSVATYGFLIPYTIYAQAISMPDEDFKRIYRKDS